MSQTNLTVLLIEDDLGDATILRRTLAELRAVKFDLVWADRLSSGLAYLSEQAFDIMLLDLSLPDSQGLDTITQVRAHTLNVPIVVLTGLDDEAVAMQAVQAGAQDYLVKGQADANALSRSIRYAVERYRLRVALEQARVQEEEALKKAYDKLETRVEERTADLKRVNGHLQAEIVERQKAETEREALVQHLMKANRSLEELTVEIQQSHRENKQVLAAISSILIGVEANGRISEWNRQAEEALGYKQADVLGRPIDTCALSWDDPTVLTGIANCRRTEQAIRLNDVRMTHADGRAGFLSLTISPIQRGPDNGLGVLILGQDITEHKLLESQLSQAQKLEAIGQLAAGIAHEINTPTQYVSDNTRFLQNAFGDIQTLLEQYSAVCQTARQGTPLDTCVGEAEAMADDIDLTYLCEEIPVAIEQSLEGLARVGSIVLAMKEFSHPGGEEKVTVDLNKAIESTITVARNEWKYVADMVTDFDPTLPLVSCLPGDINQVILNIVVNASHAIADMVNEGSSSKGTITVQTRYEGGWASIRIQDTGPGIPKAIRAKVFEPFFTTKEVGKGTGQGLAIAYAVVVEKHGGTIRFDTVAGQGTTFIIRLPLEVVASPLP